ncbi:MAG TPA: NUDIX domain-containing protein, partial [Gaiellaceae bacterium]|nr:NUDIX domain-containing protein [Gaiellaceae bacterium]
MGAEPRIRVSALLRWNDRVLLCRHEKPGKEYWLLPGGGVNSGESLVDALHRELAEELGIGEEVAVEGPVAIVDSIS